MLCLERGAHSAVAPGHHRLEEDLISLTGGKVIAPTQQQSLLELTLDVVVWRFDSTVLVGYAPIVAGRLNTVMTTELGKSFGKVFLFLAVFIGGTQAVGA